MSLNKFFGPLKSGPAPVPNVVLVKEEAEITPTPTKRARVAAPVGDPASPALIKRESPVKRETPVKREIKLEPLSAKKAATLRLFFGAKAAEKVKKMRKLRVRRGHTASWSRLRFAGMKPPLTPYAQWNSENRARIQGELKASGAATDFATVSKVVGEKWASLTDADKAPYVAKFEKLREKYNETQTAYRQYAKDHEQVREFADQQRALFRKSLKGKGLKTARAMKAMKARKRAAKPVKVTKTKEVVTPKPKVISSALEETPTAPTQQYDPTAGIASFEHRDFKTKPLVSRQLTAARPGKRSNSRNV